MRYSVVLVSAVQQSESAIYIHTYTLLTFLVGIPGDSNGKECACNVGDWGSIPGLRRSLEKEMALHPVFLLGKFHEQRRLARYSPWEVSKRVGHD